MENAIPSFESSLFSTTRRENKPYPLSPTAFPDPLGLSLGVQQTAEPLDLSSHKPMFPDARLEQFKKGDSVGRESSANTYLRRKPTLDSREDETSRELNIQSTNMHERRLAEKERHPSRYDDQRRTQRIDPDFDSRNQRRVKSLERRQVKRPDLHSSGLEYVRDRRDHSFDKNDMRRRDDQHRIDDRWEEVSDASFGQEGYRGTRRNEPDHKVLEPSSRFSDEYGRESIQLNEGLRSPRRYSVAQDFVERGPLHFYANEDGPAHHPSPRVAYQNHGARVDRQFDDDYVVRRQLTRQLADDGAYDRYISRSPRHPSTSHRTRSDFSDQYDVDRTRSIGYALDDRDADFPIVRSPVYEKKDQRRSGRGRSPLRDTIRHDHGTRVHDNMIVRSLSRVSPRLRSKSRERYLFSGGDHVEQSHATRPYMREARFSDEYGNDRSRGTRENTIESDRRSVGSSLSDLDPIIPRREVRNRREDEWSSETSSIQQHHRRHHHDETSLSEESESNYVAGRGRGSDRLSRSTSNLRSHRATSESADRRITTPSHFVIEVKEESRPEERGVTFSPSTELPAPSRSARSDLSEMSQTSADRSYLKRLADAALIKEESEARHQILREVRQAMEMRDISTDANDHSFWEKQVATLNASLKKLCSQHSSTPIRKITETGTSMNWNTPSPSQSTYTTVKVQAPENLPAGHQFTVRLNGRVLKATVPSGGVRKNDVFSIRIPLDPVEPESPMRSPSLSSVKIRAPASLPEGYRFTAKMGDRTIVATVPPGGVQKGQIFSVPVVDEQ